MNWKPNRRTVAALTLAALMLVAGCAGPSGGANNTTATDAGGVDEGTLAEDPAAGEETEDGMTGEETSEDGMADEETSEDGMADEETSEDGMADEETEDDEMAGNETADDGMAGNETTEDDGFGNETTDEEAYGDNTTAGNETGEHQTNELRYARHRKHGGAIGRLMEKIGSGVSPGRCCPRRRGPGH